MLLTERQTEILEFLRSYQEEHGITPTVAEAQERFGFKSPTAVSDHLAALERKGAIRRTPGQARNIRLIKSEPIVPSISIPVYGAIPAGFAEVSEQQSDRSIAFDAASLRMAKNSRVFALDVRGDSMIDAGILDGDVVILEHGPEPTNGDIVAALIDGETTLKRYRVKNRKQFLQAENPAYSDLTPVAELMIQGIYRGLIRVGGRRERSFPLRGMSKIKRA